MDRSLTRKSTDHSGRDGYGFSFYCDRCGKSWRSHPFPFTGGGCSEITEDEIRRMVWMREHHAAFERANLEAQFHFNYCPACGRWVCDDCFHPLGSDGRDLCHDCEAELTKGQG